MKENVLAILREQDAFYSGEAISNRLGVSRTAVWKAVKSLQQQGYLIEAVPNRGYRLTGSPDIISETEIRLMLERSHLADEFPMAAYAAQTDSTNLMARRAAEVGAPHGSIFVAGQQTAGRGRRGRSWTSQSDRDLMFSILLRPQAEPTALAAVTLLAGLCAAEAVNHMIQAAAGLPNAEKAGIKWPNDLVLAVEGLKIGGILTESLVEDNRVQALIIGIGINVNAVDLPDELVSSATSLGKACGRTFHRLDLLRLILQRFTDRKASLADLSRLDDWLDDYRRMCLTLGREIKVFAPDGTWQTGRAIDIDSSGELLIDDAAGCRQVIRSGEVSVRGLFGYV